MRKSIFISHCTPEDNQFVLWLGTRLQLSSYNVWYDLECLVGGERDFLNPIDEEIRNRASKFLLVLSSLTFKKDGVPKKSTDHPISVWYQNDFTIDRGIFKRKDTYTFFR